MTRSFKNKLDFYFLQFWAHYLAASLNLIVSFILLKFDKNYHPLNCLLLLGFVIYLISDIVKKIRYNKRVYWQIYHTLRDAIDLTTQVKNHIIPEDWMKAVFTNGHLLLQ